MKAYEYGYILIKNEAHLLIPKNASSFLIAKSDKEISKKDFLEFEIRRVNLRDPVERFHSAFRFFNGIQKKQMIYEPFNLEISIEFETFVDFALENENSHWLPQSRMILDNGIPMPNRFNWLNPNSINKVNTSEKFEYNINYKRNDILDYYKDDYIFMEKLNGY